jgi:hypothetical protein
MRVKVMMRPGRRRADMEVIHDVESVIYTSAATGGHVVAPGILLLNSNLVMWFQTMPDLEDVPQRQLPSDESVRKSLAEQGYPMLPLEP